MKVFVSRTILVKILFDKQQASKKNILVFEASLYALGAEIIDFPFS